jgi:hypothetical protein
MPAEYNRLAPFTARHILVVEDALERDYHELSSDQVTRLLSYADQYRYPRPSNEGSRGSRWHAYLSRRAAKAEMHSPLISTLPPAARVRQRIRRQMQ